MSIASIDRTLEQMLADARALAPVLRERWRETDELRRLPDTSVGDIDRLGIIGVATPTALGGSGLGPEAIFQLTFELAKGCGSTAWCAGNWAVHNLLLAAFPEQAQEECFDRRDRLPRMSTGFSPLRSRMTPADGGAVIDGSWDFASGVDHADWMCVVAVGDKGPLIFLVPTEDLKVVDTWHTSGLRGTGSKDVLAESVFVPEHRILSLRAASEARTPGRELHATPFLRVPFFSIFAPGVIGTILGLAAGGYDEFVHRTAEKLGGISGVKVGERGDVHLRMGLAASNIEAGTLMVLKTYDEVRAAGESGVYSIDDRVRWRARIAWAAKLATEAMTLLFKAGGAHVLYLDDELNRANADLIAAAQHYGVQWDAPFIDRGRVALGLDPLVTL